MDIPSHEQIVANIDAFLDRHGMKPSRLGRDATGEPDLVRSIRGGRSPSLETLNKLAAFMADYDKANNPADRSASATKPGENIRGGSGERRCLIAEGGLQ